MSAFKNSYQYINLVFQDETGEDIDIEVKAEYSINNDGIGSYEYWGQNCYDAGEDYPEVENIIPVFTDESKELQAYILKRIDDNFEAYAREAEQRLTFETDYDD